MKAMNTLVATERARSILEPRGRRYLHHTQDDDEALVIVPIAQLLQLIRRHRHEKMLRSIIGGWRYVTVCWWAQPLARERGYAKQTQCPPSCAETRSFCKDGRCDLPADHEETMCIEWHSCGCFIPEDAKSTSGLIAARGGVDASVLGQRFQDAGRHGLAL